MTLIRVVGTLGLLYYAFKGAAPTHGIEELDFYRFYLRSIACVPAWFLLMYLTSSTPFTG